MTADLQEILNDAKAKNFQVVEFVTIQTMETTLPNTARILKEQNFAGQATLKRGKKFYTARVRQNNTIAKALYVATEI